MASRSTRSHRTPEANYWSKIEGYLSARTDGQFTHGICPECDATRIAAQADSHAPS
jgi:hypothetical protein